MNKTFSLLDYIGSDISTVILNGVSLSIFLVVGYSLYKSLNTTTSESVSSKSDVGIGDTSVLTSDKIVQKFDITNVSTFELELKQKLSLIKDIGEMRVHYGDSFVDAYLGAQIGEEIDLISMALELEKWKRLCELSIVYSLCKERGIAIPGEWDLGPQSSATGSEPTSSSPMSRTSTTEPEFLRSIDTNIIKSYILPSDIASPGEGGVSNSSASSSESVGHTTPIE